MAHTIIKTLRPPRRRAAAVISALTAQQYVRIDRHREWGHRLEAPAAGERKTAPEQGRQRPRSSSRAAGRTKGKGSALLNLGWHHEAVFCSRPGNCSFPRREHLFLPGCRPAPSRRSAAAPIHLFTIHLAPPAGLRPAPLPSSLFTLTFFANKAMTCWLVQFAPPISFSPCRRKRNAPRPVQRKKRGWGENQASTVLLLDALVRGGKLVPFGTNLTCPGVPHPLARWPGACRGVVLGVQTCAPCFSFRCRWPGAHVARHFFPLHSYLFLPRSVPLGAGSKAGAGAPGLGRFKEIGFLREGGNRNPPSLKRLFGDFLAAQKVTRGPGPGRPRRWLVCRKPALRARRAR